MRQSYVPLAFTGVGGETVNLDILNGSADEWRISINTTNQITGNKTLAFVGTPFDSCVIKIFNEGGFNTMGASKLIINGDTIPDIYAASPCEIIYRYNGSVWTQTILISSGGFSGVDILVDSIPADRLQNDIAGSGMDRDINGGLIPNLEASQPSLQVSADELGVKLDATRAITKDSNGIGVNLETSDPSLQISTNELGVKIAADGGLEKTSDGMEIKVDPVGDLAVTTDGIKFGACVCIKEVTLAVDSATILDLYTTPFELIAAPGPKKYIDVISASVRVTLGTPYATNTKLIIQTKNAPGQMFESDCLGATVQRFYKFDQVPLVSDTTNQIVDNAPINLTVDAGNPTAGNSTLEVSLVYRIVTGIA